MFQTKRVKKIKIHSLRSIFFFFENGVMYAIVLKNTVERDRPYEYMAI